MNGTSSSADVVIVGAGMSGLTAALELQRAGISTIVLDKGKAAGGRMATRTINRSRFDHGAQHFSVRSEHFREMVAQLQNAGVVGEWYRSRNRTATEGATEPRLVGVGGMRAIPEHLARSLDVRTSTMVDRLQVTETGFAAVSGNEALVHSAGVILTPPIPQLLRLLEASDIRLAPGTDDALAQIEYNATLAVMATLDRPSGLPNGHLAQPTAHVAWIADNEHKGVSGVPSVTIHSTPEYAAAHLDADPTIWARELCEQVRGYLEGTVVAATGHRWRYAEPKTTLDTGSLALDSSRPAVVAGEAFSGARVEGAFLSGLAAADQIQALL